MRSSHMGGTRFRRLCGGEAGARSAPLQSGRWVWQNGQRLGLFFWEGATRILVFTVLLLVAGVGSAAAQEAPDFAAARAQMVRVIQVEALVIGEVTGVREIDQRVLAAMGTGAAARIRAAAARALCL